MKFSKKQREVLVALDGKLSPLELDGSWSKTVKSLEAMGLVSYRRVRSFAHPHHFTGQRAVYTRNASARKTTYYVSLTSKGSDFIYNGGIDH